MKVASKTRVELFVSLLFLGVCPGHAATDPPVLESASIDGENVEDIEQTNIPEEENVGGWDEPRLSGSVTPRFFFFDYFEGSDDEPHYLERYDYRKSLSGDTYSGAYPDFDVDLTYGDSDRDLFVLNRRGFGQYNHRGEARYSNEDVAVFGEYSRYRSANWDNGLYILLAGGLTTDDGTQGHQGGPGGQDNGSGGDNGSGAGGGNGGDNGSAEGNGNGRGSVALALDGSEFQDNYVDRTSYGAGLTLKPATLDDWGTISIEYRGYQRDGSKFARINLGGGGGSPAASADDTYRHGSSLPIDEHMDKLSFTLDTAPFDLFNLSYNIALERFRNDAPDLIFNQDAGPSGSGPGNGSSGRPRDRGPLFYIPDTTQQSQSFRLSRNFSGRLLLATGYSHARLSTDSTFPGSSDSSDGGYQDWNGRVISDNAFFNADWILSPAVSLEGFVKYQRRDNESTLPVTDASDDTEGSPYINAIDSMEYGVSGNWRPDVMKSTFTLGWHRTDRDRDLLFTPDSSGSNALYQGLYPESTLLDEVFLQWVSRPRDGWALRVRPSYTWADSTGFVTEPEEAFGLKTRISYADPAGWLVSGFWDYRKQKNDLNTVSEDEDALSFAQDVDTTLLSAGASLNLAPRDDLNTFLNLFWVRDDLSSYLLATARLPSSGAPASELTDKPNYNIDTYSIALGGDWYASDKFRLSGSYTYSRSKGKALGSTLTREVDNPLEATADIDNQLHSFALGGAYEIDPNVTLRANYIFDYYDDDAHDFLTDGVHTLAVGVTLEF